MPKGLPRSIRKNQEVAILGGPILAHWSNINDTEFTEPNKFTVQTDWLQLPNNAGQVITDPKFSTLDPIYDGDKITGKFGRAIIIGLRFKYIRRAGANARRVTVGFDIGGIFVEPIIQKDVGINHVPNGEIGHYNETFFGYTFDTWEKNGATVLIKADRKLEIFDFTFTLARA